MRHLISKEHHPHLKKRALLELFGLIVLVGLSYNQREILGTAIDSIRESDIFYLLLMLSIYWLLLPLTAISYRLLAYKRISIFTTALSQLAAAGPGRIIPGGLGHISIGAVHLHKIGLSMQRAILLPIANNIIGLTVNIGLILTALVIHPTLINQLRDSFSVQTFIVMGAFFIAFLTILQWLSHARKTRSTIKKVTKQWKHLISHLRKNPRRLLYVVLIALIITLGHSLILMLAGDAISMQITLTDAIIALSAGVLLGGAIPTPGGLGAVEAGTTGALVLLGYDPTLATSAALLFRVATYWQPLLPGVISYLYLRERKLL